MADTVELQKFPTLDKSTQDAVALSYAQLKEQFVELDRRVPELAGEQKHRRNIAIGLKVVSVVSGIVIATGFLEKSLVQVLGGIIPAIAALERVFANLSRLLSITAAKNAYERVRRNIVAEHNKHIIEVIKQRDSSPSAAADLLISLNSGLVEKFAKVQDDVEEKLARNDYDNLGRLSLDDEGGSK